MLVPGLLMTSPVPAEKLNSRNQNGVGKESATKVGRLWSPKSKSTAKERSEKNDILVLLSFPFRLYGTFEETKALQRKGWFGRGGWCLPSAHFPLFLALFSF